MHVVGRMSRVLAITVLAVFAVAACGGGATGTTAPSTSASTAPVSAAPSASAEPTATVATATPSASVAKGPATAEFTLTGTGGLVGAVTQPAIRCDQPSLDGMELDVFATPPVAGQALRIQVHAGRVDVNVAAGAGAAYVQRQFMGTGVTDFDPATGASLDSTLTEVATGSAAGTLGAITAIKGSIDCGNQRPGVSTLVISGSTTDLVGAVDPASVACFRSATSDAVSIIGLVQTSKPFFVVIRLAADQISVAASRPGDDTLFYTGPGKGVVTLTAAGATVAAVLAPQAGGPDRIHLDGTATCGVPFGG